MRGTDVLAATWWQRASKRKVALGAFIFAAIIFLVLTAFDLFSEHYLLFHLPMLAVDAAVSLLCGALILKIVLDAQARHRAVMRRLAMISELNHHIRNALDQIELSAHTTRNAEVISLISSAVGRIEWALREVVPQEMTEGHEQRTGTGG